MRADTRLPPYLPYPRFLLQTDLTQTAKLLYALLLDRATLSQANGWLDEGGRIYLVFPIEKIAAALDRSPMTVKNALSELEDAGLIERRRSGFSKPNRIYVKVFLTDTEYAELLREFPDRLDRLISELSSYMESTGRSYQNHAATIRRWAENDKTKGVPKQGIPDYTCKEGESL